MKAAPSSSWHRSRFVSQCIKSADPKLSAQQKARKMEVVAAIWTLHPPRIGPGTFEHDLVEIQSEEQDEDEEDKGIEDGTEAIDSSGDDE